MTYVPGRAADVFISHAHVDNQELAGRRWVSEFAAALQKRLDQELGVTCGTVNVWMDHEIDGSRALTPQLIQSIDAAAVLVCIVSVGYVQSKWCELEWAQFLRERQLQAQAGGAFFVFIRNLPRETLPAQIQALDLPGYEFWAVDPENQLDYTVGGPGDPGGSPEAQIHRQLQRRLIRDMSRELRRLHAAHQLAAAAAAPAGSAVPGPPSPVTPVSTALSRELAGQCIFLAEVTDDLDDHRDGVRTFLEQRSATVLPAQRYANRDPDAYAAAVRADLAHATAFVQLLGPFRGREKSSALPLGLPGLQHQLAQQTGQPLFRWRAAGELPPDMAADWRGFLEAASVDACPIEAFKTQLLRRLAPTPAPPQLPGPAPDGLMVFVNSGRDDAGIAHSLRHNLGARKVTAFVPFWAQPLKDYNAEWRTLLKRCDGVIHVCGSTGATWVRRQLLESDRVLAMRQSRVRGKALGDAAWQGRPEQELGVNLPDFHIIDCTSGVVDQQALDRFVNSLRS